MIFILTTSLLWPTFDLVKEHNDYNPVDQDCDERIAIFHKEIKERDEYLLTLLTAILADKECKHKRTKAIAEEAIDYVKANYTEKVQHLLEYIDHAELSDYANAIARFNDCNDGYVRLIKNLNEIVNN